MHQSIFWAPFQFPSRTALGADQKLSFDWGAFTNYVDKILSTIDHLPTAVDICEAILLK